MAHMQCLVNKAALKIMCLSNSRYETAVIRPVHRSKSTESSLSFWNIHRQLTCTLHTLFICGPCRIVLCEATNIVTC